MNTSPVVDANRRSLDSHVCDQPRRFFRCREDSSASGRPGGGSSPSREPAFGVDEFFERFWFEHGDVIRGRVVYEGRKYRGSPDVEDLQSDVMYWLWRWHGSKLQDAENPVGYACSMVGMIVRQRVLVWVGFERAGRSDRRFRVRGKRGAFVQVGESEDGWSVLDVVVSRESDPAGTVMAADLLAVAMAKTQRCFRGRQASLVRGMAALSRKGVAWRERRHGRFGKVSQASCDRLAGRFVKLTEGFESPG